MMQDGNTALPLHARHADTRRGDDTNNSTDNDDDT